MPKVWEEEVLGEEEAEAKYKIKYREKLRTIPTERLCQFIEEKTWDVDQIIKELRQRGISEGGGVKNG